MSGPWIKANWSGQTGDGKSERQRSRNQRTKRTGMDEFNSDDHYIYYYGQKSLRINGIAILVNKRFWNAVFGCNLKNDIMISVSFQGKPFNITVIKAYVPTSNGEEAEVELFHEDLCQGPAPTGPVYPRNECHRQGRQTDRQTHRRLCRRGSFF